MKKTSFKISMLLSAVAFCFSIAGCQKEVGREEDPANPTPGTFDSLYLDKVYFADSTNGIKDTFYYNQYVYDASRRVTKLNSFVKDDLGVFFLREYFEYDYTGNDTLPVKQRYITTAATGAFQDTTTHFYTYLPSGKLSVDSVSNRYHVISTSPETSNFTHTFRYQYATNKIYTAITYTADGQPEDHRVERDTATTDAVMNVLNNKHYYDDGTGSFVFERSGNFTYESTPSPFAKLSNFKTLALMPYGETFFYDMQSYNNRTTANETELMGNGYQEDLTGNWQYGSNGYPSRVRTKADPANPGYFEITLFKYRSF